MRLVDRVQHGPVHGQAALSAALCFPPDCKAMRTQVYKRILEAYPVSERSQKRALVESGIVLSVEVSIFPVYVSSGLCF